MAIQNGNVKLDISVLDMLIRTGPGKLDAWMEGVANAMKDEIVVTISGPSPSAPGDPPGMDTGALRESITVEKTGEMNYALSSQVGYGGYLELGTEKMAARPFFVPVFEEWYGGKLVKSAAEADLLR